MNRFIDLLENAFNLQSKGKFQEAINLILKLIEDQNDNPNLYFFLGNLYLQIEKNYLAFKYLNISISLKNNNIPHNHLLEAYNNCGIALKRINKYHKALINFDKAIQINPEYSQAYNNRGNVLYELKYYDKALIDFEKAIQINPKYSQAYNNRGNVLRKIKLYELAIENFKKAIQINPKYYEAYNNLGNVYKDMHLYHQAHENYKLALSFKPNYVKALMNMGNSLVEINKYEKALSFFEKVNKIDPDYKYLIGDILDIKMQLNDWDKYDFYKKKIIEGIKNNKKIIHPFSLLSIVDDPYLQKKSSKIYMDDKFPKQNNISNLKKYNNHDKFKIGYFSSDFHDHAVLHLAMDIFKKHNKKKFELYGFSLGQNINDNWNQEVKKYFDKFIDIKKISDKGVAELCRQLEIDIAVDLNGLTQFARPEIFSYRVAPIQINYLGYPGTVHAEYFDYIIADKIIIPKKSINNFSEKVIYLPNCYQANMENRKIPNTGITKKHFNLPENKFLFCCINNTYKINPEVMRLWINILKKVPNSVLCLLKSSEISIKNIYKEANIQGIESKRLIFLPRLSSDHHLARLGLFDIFLDTFPYNAHTTASEIIRMGVPIITLMGNSFASRVAGSILSHCSMTELITYNKEDYLNLAVKIANSKKLLINIKNKLKKSLSKCSLFKSTQFTQDLENIFIKILK